MCIIEMENIQAAMQSMCAPLERRTTERYGRCASIVQIDRISFFLGNSIRAKMLLLVAVSGPNSPFHIACYSQTQANGETDPKTLNNGTTARTLC